ncbi:MAG: DUF4956 domain-containing protein [Actinomycetota bacterium]
MADIELFGRRVMQSEDVALLLSSLVLNVIVLGVIVGFQYYRQTRDRDHTFMMVTLNLVVFLVGFFMNSVQIGVGFGFGLFALFGVVRYRTESVPVREMSYLFAVIAVGLTNAVGADVLSWVEVIIADATIATALGALSATFWRHGRFERRLVYDQVENLRPERRTELEIDLWERTGIIPLDIQVVSINLVNDSAVLRLTCDSRVGGYLPMVDVRAPQAPHPGPSAARRPQPTTKRQAPPPRPPPRTGVRPSPTPDRPLPPQAAPVPSRPQPTAALGNGRHRTDEGGILRHDHPDGGGA